MIDPSIKVYDGVVQRWVLNVILSFFGWTKYVVCRVVYFYGYTIGDDNGRLGQQC